MKWACYLNIFVLSLQMLQICVFVYMQMFVSAAFNHSIPAVQ